MGHKRNGLWFQASEIHRFLPQPLRLKLLPVTFYSGKVLAHLTIPGHLQRTRGVSMAQKRKACIEFLDVC